MIYDPITRQSVEILGRFPPQNFKYRFGGREPGGEIRFVKVRYGEHLPGFSGGFAVGEIREADLAFLVADDGIREIEAAYRASPEVEK